LDAQESLQVRNGRLLFATHDVFERTMIDISRMSASELRNRERANLKYFTSMRTRFESISDQERMEISEQLSTKGYEDVVTLVQDDTGDFEARINAGSLALATLFNDRGIVQIKDQAIRLEFDKSKVIAFESEDKLAALITDGWKSLPASAKIYSVENNAVELTAGKSQARVGECEDRYLRDRRFKGELWISNTPPIYSGTGARSKHQNRFFAGLVG
jgi:hypothetical protein